ncbi:hypothetical protein BHU72_12485 [Desulfuribacillus stibiiarsenatis]|uniref:Uncharacterized protein n=1 Tax=Desulfuribacillus stibiiarsenatis TaxID=1390249 RepID=A0A1E5L286_9FIRM|nr:hypothetical protein [Desulfuribacillus stibiiarsenatis]OEH84214.1 hypothetical protein BHU72_12485 [Desulfuribacillus stibiiarsenatis]
MLDKLRHIQTNLSDRDKKLLMVVAVVLLLATLYWSLFQWYLPSTSQLHESKQLLQQEIGELQSTVLKMKDMEQKTLDQRKSFKDRFGAFNWQVLKGEPLLVLGDQSQVRDKNFSMVALNQGEVNVRGSLWEIPYTIQAKGSIQSIQDYLAYIDNQEKALLPEYLRIDYHNSFESDKRDEIWLELQLNALGSLLAEDVAPVVADPSSRENVFQPTVTITNPGNVQPSNPSQQPTDGVEERTPRYTFPTKKEVKQ